MSTNRQLLDLLGRETLVRLMRERNLAPTRENDERRKALAHSYHGDVETLIRDLTRQELVDVFKACTFDYRGVQSCVSNPGKYRLDELQAFATRAFTDRRVRIPADFTPVELEEDENEDSDDDEDELDDDPDEDGDEAEADDEDEEEASIADVLGIDSGGWSRPRMIDRILNALGYEPVRRLRTARFQDLIAQLTAGGIDACLADDPTETVLTASDESPGIDTKLRLRRGGDGGRAKAWSHGGQKGKDRADVAAVERVLRASRSPMRARDIARMLGLPRARINAALYENVGSLFTKNEEDFSWSIVGRETSTPATLDGGPRIVVQAGEKPVPLQVARPSDYNLAVLRLQFLTAVPSAERRSLAAWPDGYLTSATRGLSLRAQELALLRAYSAGLCIGNHNPYDAIPRLSQVLSPTEWESLLDDFQALNPFQPELVQAIVQQVEPVTAPRSSAGTWRGAQAAPLDLEQPHQAAPAVEPRAAASTKPGPTAKTSELLSPNHRDLGALAGMFDED